MRKSVSFFLGISSLLSCTYIFDIPSSLNAKEIHHLISNDTVIYLRIQNFKEMQQNFLQTTPISAIRKSLLFQQFQKSKEYENLQRGIEFGRWLFETSPQEVFDNFFGQDVILTLVPKVEEKGFYGILVCELGDPQKSLTYLDILYRYILQKKGIVREERMLSGPMSQHIYSFQNTHQNKKEVFTLTLTDRFLLLSNDENLVLHAIQQIQQKSEPFFLQNNLVQETLAQLPSSRFLTFYAHTEKIFSQFPQLFQKKPHPSPTKLPQILENKATQIIRDLRTIGCSISLEKNHLQFATTASFQHPHSLPAFPQEILPLSQYLSPHTFSLLNVRFFNHFLHFVQESEWIKKHFQKLNALFEGKNFLQTILPFLGEEITFNLTELPSHIQVSSAPLKLPALNLFISGRPSTEVLKPLLNSLTTIFTAVSFEKPPEFELQANLYRNTTLYSLKHKDLALFGEQLFPAYAIVGDRLVLSTSRFALQEIIDLFQEQKTIAQKHPFFRHIFQNRAVQGTQNLFAPIPHSFFSIQLKKIAQFLQINTPTLLADSKRENPPAEEQWAFLLDILHTLENLTFCFEPQKEFTTFRVVLQFD